MAAPIRPIIPPVVSPLERGLGQPLGLPPDEAPFSELLTRALGDVNRLQETKADLITAFLRGEPVELHQVMAAAEEASLSLEFLVESRNKLLDAYRTMMNLQV